MYEKIEEKISCLRKDMHRLIEEKDNLLDPEIIKISKDLDILLNQYNNMYLIKKNVGRVANE